jgi:acyl-CoA reductase-like NAD-dependent aldehyde dehydrogenase
MATTFNSVDPRTGETGPAYEEATLDDVRDAVAAAAAVHRSGALGDRGARATLLRGAASRLRAA